MVDHLPGTGSGITHRRTRARAVDSDEAIAELNAGHAMMFDFEAYTAGLRSDAEAVLEQIEATHGHKPWRPHEDLEWYYYEMIREHNNALEHIARGDASGAACSAMRFQEVFTELKFKRGWEAFALYGQKRKETAAAGGTKTRRQTVAQRKAEVSRLRSEGKSLRNSFKIAARNFGVSAGAIQRDWYGLR